MGPYVEIGHCRICGNADLDPVLSLGSQALTGVFPGSPEQEVPGGPLELVRCVPGEEACGLLQLKQTYDKGSMFGSDYGYHSALNPSMVAHLRSKVAAIRERVSLGDDDLVIDIGANDGTLLSCYEEGPRLLGVDPLGEKFRASYPPHVELLSEFFTGASVRSLVGDQKAKIITSIAMFYDLDAPMEIVQSIAELLADDGVWVLEQSYLPTMVENNAYDTICHEHLEYYGLRQIHWMTHRAGLEIIDVELNPVNGGSFSVTVARPGTRLPRQDAKVQSLLEAESGYAEATVYSDFAASVRTHRLAMRAFFEERRDRGETVLGLGASTKGNVVLQYCGITPADLPAIGEVNPDKYGHLTPGTGIPIIPDGEMRARKPDYLFVLPWHFKDFIVENEREYLQGGGKLFFPLPTPHTVSAGPETS